VDLQLAAGWGMHQEVDLERAVWAQARLSKALVAFPVDDLVPRQVVEAVSSQEPVQSSQTCPLSPASASSSL